MFLESRMKRCAPVVEKACAWLAAGVVVFGLCACSGGGDDPPASSAAASEPLTQSTITLPSSVQVVTAN